MCVVGRSAFVKPEDEWICDLLHARIFQLVARI